MKPYVKCLGKVSVTVNGIWSKNKPYERLSIVSDGNFATYISKQDVPTNIELTNTDYWQPIAALAANVKNDYDTFKEFINNTINNLTDFVHHLTPEINIEDFRREIINMVDDMYRKGMIKLGITTVDRKIQLNKAVYTENGNFVFCKEDNTYYTYKDGTWFEVPIIYFGEEDPYADVLWVDPQDNHSIKGDDDERLTTITKAIADLQNKINAISKVVSLGVIPGDATSSTRNLLIYSAEPLKPDASSSEITDEDKPDENLANKTVSCICCKMDTAVNFSKNKKDLIDGEIIFYTDRKKFAVYYGGKFYLAGTGEAGGSGGGISLDDLYAQNLTHLNFINNNNKLYKLVVNEDGTVVTKEFEEKVASLGVTNSAWGVYGNYLLTINSIFIGGSGSEDSCCTHNFVELANGGNEDINLKGMYLLYTDGSKDADSDIGYTWDYIELEGVIKAGSTFLIRGAQCTDNKHALIDVDTYDMIWTKNNVPIKFNQGKSSFYLCVTDAFKTLLETKTLNNPWLSKSIREGYIDSCGFGEGSVGEGSATFLVPDDWNKVIFTRQFTLDPSKQANKAYAKRTTTGLWQYINIDKNTTKLGNSIQYYHDQAHKLMSKPLASYMNKTFFTNKTTFNTNQPNYVNCLFGIQATDNGHGATRCFNWVSVGEYDEFVEYRKVGDTDWKRVYSIINNNVSNPDWIKKFINHYKRFTWCASNGVWVTTHKAIIKNINKGKYEYRIGRDDNNNYHSDILTFTVEADSDVTSFKYIQVTDQQGFNYEQYIAWWKTAYMINANEDYNFLINTGDITQSGNRANEWLDYYQGKKNIIDKTEMFTIGNNDLCGHDSTKLTNGEDSTSKYSHINVLRYFCFELDVNNEYSFEWQGDTYPIYSLYSFNYGKYHFVCLNSEIATASSKMYKDWQSDDYAGDITFAQTANAVIEQWLKKDLQIYKGVNTEPTDCKNVIVYMHEMPFTMVTWDFMRGSGARAGSHLNTHNANGKYRFSRLFKKYGIRLVMGGHKHTYTISKPIYDAADNYVSGNSPVEGQDLLADITDAESRKPVIQVTNSKFVDNTNQFAKYEVVDKINAPIYVMSQSSGYKLVSNKEQPSGNEYTIPWLLAYYRPKTNASSPKENVAQHFPMYITYEVTDTNIKITAKQVVGIWDVNVDKNTSKYDLNNQINDLSIQTVTLDTTIQADKECYNLNDGNSLIIDL